MSDEHTLSLVIDIWNAQQSPLSPAVGLLINCQCGAEFRSDTRTEVVGLAMGQLNPDISDFARDLYSGE